MSRYRKIHFVIHNRGEYDHQKKVDFLNFLEKHYGKTLQGYLIAQEMYKDDPSDSHLQGNLFFKNAIYKSAILKKIQKVYREIKTDKGTLNRTQIMEVNHEGKAYNYMINPAKDGGDPAPLIDIKCWEQSKFIKELELEIRQTWQEVVELDRQRREGFLKEDDEF